MADKDRYGTISEDFAKFWVETTAAYGVDYRAFERAIFDCANRYPNLKDARILELGTGDGETISPFIEHGCKFVTGIELNSRMIEASRERFGDKLTLIQGDIRRLDLLQLGTVDVLVSACTIHNIPKSERPMIWSGIRNIGAKLFVYADTIVDRDPQQHRQNCEDEMNAIRRVYGDKYNRWDLVAAWEEHNRIDEQERLEFQEIEQELGGLYDFEMEREAGKYKLLRCSRKREEA